MALNAQYSRTVHYVDWSLYLCKKQTIKHKTKQNSNPSRDQVKSLVER